MTARSTLACMLFGLLASATPAAAQPAPPPAPQLTVFLDCRFCFQEFLRSDITFVDFVRDRTEADVHVLVTSTITGGGGREFTVTLLGSRRFQGTNYTFRTVSTRGDPEDVVRRQIANALRVGLLNYVARDGVPPQLAVAVQLGSEASRPAVAGDRWNNWVFSVRGYASFEGEESNRERQFGGRLSADRITPDWKVTLGAALDHETEEFDLDENDPVKVNRRERDFRGLLVKALGEHWSIGGLSEIESSTFENTELALAAAPAVEFNVFPYSAYTRRQLRALYAVGVRTARYYERTLFGRTEETRPLQEISVTYEQREQWGSLEGRTVWSQYLHELDRSRLEADGEVAIRLARGLSVQADVGASRIRDQLFLPARGATPEEVLLRIRRLQSGYEYRFSFGLTYTFGSIFSSVVNPRFGR